MGYTIVDSLDSLLVLGFEEEYLRARDWVRDSLDFDKDAEFNTFEVSQLVHAALFVVKLMDILDHDTDSGGITLGTPPHVYTPLQGNIVRLGVILDQGHRSGRSTTGRIPDTVWNPIIQYQSGNEGGHSGYGQPGCGFTCRGGQSAIGAQVFESFDGRLRVLEEGGEGECMLLNIADRALIEPANHFAGHRVDTHPSDP